MPQYLYQPLQHDDSIRILILHPSSNDSNPITGTIQHARLSDVLQKEVETDESPETADSWYDTSDGSDMSAGTDEMSRHDAFGISDGPDISAELDAFHLTDEIIEPSRSHTSDESDQSDIHAEASGSHGHDDADKNDELHVVECLEYEALSYTWGRAGGMKFLRCIDSSQTLRVRDNCYNALRRLRRKDINRSLWIDAICINQQDQNERARQVRLMDRIFGLATGVVVYLGEQVTKCRALFDSLATLDDLIATRGPQSPRERPSDEIIQQLLALYELPWFDRVWVLQEVCGKRSVSFVYGAATTSFAALHLLVFGYPPMAVTRFPYALEWINRPPKHDSVPQISLWRRLFETCQFLATDSRDKIFALQSLLGPDAGALDALIDYNQSLEECFTGVATFLMPVIGPRLLLAIRQPHKLSMSSWIPDWSQNLPLNPFQTLTAIAPIEGGQFEIHDVANEQCSSTSLELRVKGCKYASIVSRSCVFSFEGEGDARTKMYDFCDGLFNSMGKGGRKVCEKAVSRFGREILDGQSTGRFIYDRNLSL